jgi:hypothetical protein
MLNRKKLTTALRDLADFVETCSDEEIVALELVGASGLFTSSGTRNSPGRAKSSKTSQDEDSRLVSETLESLRYVQTRESGFSFLERKGLTRRSLERVARSLDLPVLREDTTQRLQERIVESSIGSRLNSEAIRGDQVAKESAPQ